MYVSIVLLIVMIVLCVTLIAAAYVNVQKCKSVLRKQLLSERELIRESYGKIKRNRKPKRK